MNNLFGPCQIADSSVRDELPCPATDSHGVQCEVIGPHEPDGHRVSDHTIAHSLAGNGYPCLAIGSL